METRAVARYVRISPRKARLVTDLITGKDLADARQILDYNQKAAARVVFKVLASAVANAENNNKLSPEDLFVVRAYVDVGPTLKRFRPRAMGRATRINKRTSHITVVLDEKAPERVPGKRRRLRRPRLAAVEGKEAEVAKAVSEDEDEEREERKASPKERAAKPAAGKKPAKKPAGKAKSKKAVKPATAPGKKEAAGRPAPAAGKKKAAAKPAAGKKQGKSPLGKESKREE